jgi:hypothetical protein
MERKGCPNCGTWFDELTSLRARVLVLEGALEKVKALSDPTVRNERPRHTLEDIWDIAHIALQGLSQDQGREGYGVSGGRVQAGPIGPTQQPLSAGSKPPSDHLVICIPSVESGMDVTVEAFPGEPMAAQDALLEADAKGWYAHVVHVYRHHGRGPLDNKWWGGMWTGYRARFDALKSSEAQPNSPSAASASNIPPDDPNTSLPQQRGGAE